MFVEAIEKATQFTRAIHSISRNYESDIIIPGAGTLFFVNSDGWALTCGHVAKLIMAAESIAKRNAAFKKELAERTGTGKYGRLKKELEKKYKIDRNNTYEIKNTFTDCITGGLSLKGVLHETLDIALFKFSAYDKLLCDSFPIFPKDTSSLKAGRYLCRLGFPFPEFKNYEIDTENDTIIWTETGQRNTPWFPIEGMYTRGLVDAENNLYGFELSTPGLRGQSGGPAFDTDGIVWGMQSRTAHLDLDFDVDVEVIRKGKKKRVEDKAFLHVGHCVHVDELKKFMRQHKVDFIEE